MPAPQTPAAAGAAPTPHRPPRPRPAQHERRGDAVAGQGALRVRRLRGRGGLQPPDQGHVHGVALKHGRRAPRRRPRRPSNAPAPEPRTRARPNEAQQASTARGSLNRMRNRHLSCKITRRRRGATLVARTWVLPGLRMGQSNVLLSRASSAPIHSQIQSPPLAQLPLAQLAAMARAALSLALLALLAASVASAAPSVCVGRPGANGWSRLSPQAIKASAVRNGPRCGAGSPRRGRRRGQVRARAPDAQPPGPPRPAPPARRRSRPPRSRAPPPSPPRRSPTTPRSRARRARP